MKKQKSRSNKKGVTPGDMKKFPVAFRKTYISKGMRIIAIHHKITSEQMTIQQKLAWDSVVSYIRKEVYGIDHTGQLADE